jgi:hypothetical protein
MNCPWVTLVRRGRSYVLDVDSRIKARQRPDQEPRENRRRSGPRSKEQRETRALGMPGATATARRSAQSRSAAPPSPGDAGETARLQAKVCGAALTNTTTRTVQCNAPTHTRQGCVHSRPPRPTCARAARSVRYWHVLMPSHAAPASTQWSVRPYPVRFHVTDENSRPYMVFRSRCRWRSWKASSRARTRSIATSRAACTRRYRGCSMCAVVRSPSIPCCTQLPELFRFWTLSADCEHVGVAELTCALVMYGVDPNGALQRTAAYFHTASDVELTSCRARALNSCASDRTRPDPARTCCVHSVSKRGNPSGCSYGYNVGFGYSCGEQHEQWGSPAVQAWVSAQAAGADFRQFDEHGDNHVHLRGRPQS